MPDRGSLATGIGLGAALMYWLDPQGGRRRRALVRDQLAHAVRVGGDALGATSRDVKHRTYGTAAQLGRSWFRRAVDDDTLVARVRSRLGRVVSHPHAIDVSASDGVVNLRGPILQAEVSRLLQTVAVVRGVRDVVNELEEHKQAGDVPALQGGTTPPGIRPDVLQRRWSPATRLIAGAGGAALTTYGASRRDVPGALLALGGLGLVARAITNLESGRLTGLRDTRRAVDIQKTITIDAPSDTVFAFWTAYENFPRFMSRVLEVRPSSREGQSHWTVAGPAGVPVEFDAEVTQMIPNEVFAWRTVEGATVAHAGIIHFEPTSDRRTRVNIRMSYNPPGGWLGHGVASAFGVDPKTSMDADLARMKTLIETGQPPRDAARP
jgi:uncharacterized membrane protein